jgi:GNAT superfamily N-acetyltransferase
VVDAVRLRPGRDDDAPGFIALIAACWAEYPGCVFDLDGEVPELRALATYCARKAGALWVAEASVGVVGMVYAAPGGDGAWEVGKMYVDRCFRGLGLARDLLETAEAHARAQGAVRLELWSDTRFERAHAFYEKAGYVRRGAIRTLDDQSNSIEFHYEKLTGGVLALDVAAADSAVGRLSALLKACIDEGAPLPFILPASLQQARTYWRDVARGVATGSRVLLAAWADGALAGTVQLDLGTSSTRPHRAGLDMLLVDPSMRRRGIARSLVAAAEHASTERGRWLLTSQTSAGSVSEALLRGLGWQEWGRVADYMLDTSGALREAVFLKRRSD